MHLTTLHLQEGINDKNILKGMLLAGGPGSGKSFIVDEVIGKAGPVSGLGVVLISSDLFFENQLEKAGLPKLIDLNNPHQYVLQMAERDIAKALTRSKLRNILNGMLPILIDGTGQNGSKVLRQKMALENIGYDVGMLFVDTSLEVSLERNARRSRTLDEKIVIEAWNKAHANKAAFKSAFGSNFYEIENSKVLEGSELNSFRSRLFKMGKRFYESPLKNPRGKELLSVMNAVSAKTISDLQFQARKEPISKMEV
jgi:hypothetical protein